MPEQMRSRFMWTPGAPREPTLISIIPYGTLTLIAVFCIWPSAFLSLPSDFHFIIPPLSSFPMILKPHLAYTSTFRSNTPIAKGMFHAASYKNALDY
ncbi:hypothetical protein NPIL_271891 [Nephila pilipes]|uniref:Uncharacterized protein n=1 Tax=Nephila pilipes TaxID=299642 RepID=A0A8X6P6A3_NEPPI|nr:hypothetical protein NPIL_271891 [Nephila pilipes]